MVLASEVARQPLPCIVCGKYLFPVFPRQDQPDQHQPNGAVMFRSSGNYGSTVFDPLDSRDEIEINVCDECVTRHQDRIWYIRYVPSPVRVGVSRPFKVTIEDGS